MLEYLKAIFIIPEPFTAIPSPDSAVRMEPPKVSTILLTGYTHWFGLKINDFHADYRDIMSPAL